MSKNTQKQIVSFESLMVSLLAEYTEELSKDTPSLTASMEIGEKMIEIGKMQKHMFCLFSLVVQWALFPRFGVMCWCHFFMVWKLSEDAVTG